MLHVSRCHPRIDMKENSNVLKQQQHIQLSGLSSWIWLLPTLNRLPLLLRLPSITERRWMNSGSLLPLPTGSFPLRLDRFDQVALDRDRKIGEAESGNAKNLHLARTWVGRTLIQRRLQVLEVLRLSATLGA